MANTESYTTIEAPATAEFVEKKSRFIGEIRPVQSEEQATAFLAEKRTAHWDASHNCHAYILRTGTQRYSDDGEPQGTAGVPILEVLRREGIEDVMVVVTRYFGGTLLGAGGLVRAYSHSAKIALDAARRVIICRCTVFSLHISYPYYDRVALLLQEANATLLSTDFAEAVEIRARLRETDYPAFTARLTELSAATIHPSDLDTEYAPIHAER